MAVKIQVYIAILLLCIGIGVERTLASHHDDCRKALLHSDFQIPCGKLSAVHKRPCMVSSPEDEKYLKDAEIKYFYEAPDVTGPMICASRWNSNQSAECVAVPQAPDRTIDWTWSEWSPSDGNRKQRRIILSGYDSDAGCNYVESKAFIKDCAVAKSSGHRSGVTTIEPDETTSMEVYCDQDTDGGGWIVFQKRISNSDFYLDWENYVEGFGDPATNYWLGLENIHRLTAMSYNELKVVLEYPEGTFAEADYKYFNVQDSSTNYTLQVDGFSSTSKQRTRDALSYHNGMKFSTHDADHDAHRSINCAEMFNGAWWHRSCHQSNLNGMFGVAGSRGMGWYGITQASTKMMIR